MHDPHTCTQHMHASSFLFQLCRLHSVSCSLCKSFTHYHAVPFTSLGTLFFMSLSLFRSTSTFLLVPARFTELRVSPVGREWQGRAHVGYGGRRDSGKMIHFLPKTMLALRCHYTSYKHDNTVCLEQVHAPEELDEYDPYYSVDDRTLHTPDYSGYPLDGGYDAPTPSGD